MFAHAGSRRLVVGPNKCMTLFAISFGWVAAALGRSRVCARSALAFSGARSAPKRSTLFAMSSGWAAAAGRRWVAGGFESWLPLESRSLHKHAYVVVEFCGQLGWWISWWIFCRLVWVGGDGVVKFFVTPVCVTLVVSSLGGSRVRLFFWYHVEQFYLSPCLGLCLAHRFGG